MEKRKGHYLGTEIDGRWWKRYRADGFFARGSGEWWFDEEYFYFRRYLTKQPIKIPRRRIIRITNGYWHAGKWAAGIPILKMVWERDTLKLCSGFAVSKKKTEIMQLVEQLLKR